MASSRTYSPRDAQRPGWTETQGYLVARECVYRKRNKKKPFEHRRTTCGLSDWEGPPLLSSEAIVCEVKQIKNRKQYITSVWVLFWLFREKNESEREELWPD